MSFVNFVRNLLQIELHSYLIFSLTRPPRSDIFNFFTHQPWSFTRASHVTRATFNFLVTNSPDLHACVWKTPHASLQSRNPYVTEKPCATWHSLASSLNLIFHARLSITRDSHPILLVRVSSSILIPSRVTFNSIHAWTYFIDYTSSTNVRFQNDLICESITRLLKQ